MEDAEAEAPPTFDQPLAFDRPTSVGYTRWRLTYMDATYGAIPLQQREGGILLALPASSAATEDLEAAEESGFTGFLGPSLQVTVPLLGAASRALSTSASVLVIDLSTSSEAGVAVVPATGPDPPGMIHFGSIRGRGYWLHPSGVRIL